MRTEEIQAARHVLSVLKVSGLKITKGDPRGESWTRHIEREGVAVVVRVNRNGTASIRVCEPEGGRTLCVVGYFLPQKLSEMTSDLIGLLKLLEPETVH